MSDKNFYRSE